MRPERERLPSLDGLRSLVLLVMLVHFSDGVDLQGWAQSIRIVVTVAAVIGMDVFFALSGFLITGILIDTRASQSYFRTFYARRFLRIFPLYYGFLVLYLVVLPAVIPADPQELRLDTVEHLAYWAYFTNFTESLNLNLAPNTSHLWSLCVEEQFYLVWPLVVWAVSVSRLRTICLWCLFAAPVIRLYLMASFPDSLAFYKLPFSHLDGLALGALIAISKRNTSGLASTIKWMKPASALSMVVVLAVGFIVVRSTNSQQLALHATAVFLTASAYLAGGVITLSLVSGPGSLWRRLTANVVLSTIGKHSYATYLLHDPLAYLMDRFGLLLEPAATDGPAVLLAYTATMVALSLGVGALSWHFYEQPLLRLKRYLPYERTGERNSSAAGAETS